MAKSIKLKEENYIDSSGIVNNKETLKNVLNRQELFSGVTVVGLENGGATYSSEVTIQKTGYYAVNFFVNMCGASSITNVGAYYSIRLIVNGSAVKLHNMAYDRYIVLPIAKVWNYVNTAIVFVSLKAGDVVSGEFVNNTGISTNGTWGSDFGFKLVKVSE